MNLPFTFKRIDEQHYVVTLFGVELGEVYYDAECWSHCRWMIVGGRRGTCEGGVEGKTTKRFGNARSRTEAARHLAIMQSGKLIGAMP